MAKTKQSTIAVDNQPGAEKLAAKGVNLNSIHATAAKGGKKAVVVYTVEAAARAAVARA